MLSMISYVFQNMKWYLGILICSKSVAKTGQVRSIKHSLVKKLGVMATTVLFHFIKSTWLQRIVCLSSCKY